MVKGNRHGTSSELAGYNNDDKLIMFVVFTHATADAGRVAGIQGKEPNESEHDAVQ